MAIENLIESRLKNPNANLCDKKNIKESFRKIKKYVLVDNEYNLIFYASTEYNQYFYYAFKCDNTKEDIEEVNIKISHITEDSPCYDLFWKVFPELKGQHNNGYFYKLEYSQYYDYSILNEELERIQNKINFLNYDNALEKSLESVLANMDYYIDSYDENAWDQLHEISRSLSEIDFLNDMDFLIISKNYKIRNWYKFYLDGCSFVSVNSLQLGK
ncbi:hypothetical protein [Treponema sp.]|uniref:hypothetical protein n=1 Tax=Treponema sp. TaxID=166 RepID=UPI00388E4E1F